MKETRTSPLLPPRNTLHDVLFMTAGLVLSTMGLVNFLIPMQIVPGGLTGIGTILFHKFGIPIGMFVMGGNVILIAVQAKLIGARSSGKTIVAIVVQNIVLDLLTSVYCVAPWANEPMLAALYGGILGGLGVACMFQAGATTGGSEIIAQLLLKLRGVPVGTTLWVADAVVTLAAGMAFGPALALYALIKVYVSGVVIDGFLEGFAVKRLVLIVSSQAEAIGWGIIEELNRGATILNARGMYTGKPTEVLLTAIQRHQVPFLEKVVYSIDPNAFIIVSDARRILGKGFEELGEVVRDA